MFLALSARRVAVAPEPRLVSVVPMGARWMTSYRLQALKSRPRRPRPSRSKPELPLHQWLIKKHDFVEVNQGPEEGKRGKVIDRQWRENTVTVEGVQLKLSESIDPDSASMYSPSFVTKEEPQPLHFSLVSLIDPATDARCDDIEWRWKDGRKARVSHATDAVVPLPKRPPFGQEESIPIQYAETLVTRRDDVLAVTYVPLPEYSMHRAKQLEASNAAGIANEPREADARVADSK